jgi:hypothetical protein
MTKKVLIILSIFGVAVALHFSATADVVDSTAARDTSIYRFHLFYDSGQLYANRDFKFKYDVIPNVFVAENITTSKPFSAEITGVKNQILATFKFDPQKGKSNFVKGAINVDGPYFADAAEVNFYNAQNQKLLTLDVSGSSFCNDDGICDSDVGENYQNCPNDCPRPTPSPSPTYQPPAPSVWQNMLIPVLVAAVIVIVVLVIWVIIKRRRGGSGQIPPQIPPAAPITPAAP